MLITAAIPTKNRPVDLGHAVASVCAQSRRPDELLVIDQSAEDTSRERVDRVVAAMGAGLELIYVRDPNIPGLVAAKKAAVERARGDIICFLEDDVVLEPDYLSSIERGFIQNPQMKGCCGVVTNLPQLPPFYARLFHFFHRGIFRDPRVGVHGAAKPAGSPLIKSDYLSGGLSAYRREVFDAIAFDAHNDFFMLEDVDFSTRAAQRFGQCFYINTAARLEHRMSPLNRAVLAPRQRRKVREFLVFYKKRRQARGSAGALLLLLAGLLLEAGYQAFEARHPSPIAGYLLGLRDGLRWKVAPESR